ncbi:RHS domain-containing protein, partial [Pseudomonas sp. RIT-PI-AD]|uniref:RHS domain-containing protein n=1 Tax=Pseudomonas sp. RIT-PI-AD TaxID=3035294 RepID=UPI0021DAC16D
HVVEVQDESAQGTSEILYFHTDHLGTPRELTDVSGHIVWSATYKAWGNTAKIEHPGRFVHQVVGNTLVERWQEQSD